MDGYVWWIIFILKIVGLMNNVFYCFETFGLNLPLGTNKVYLSTLVCTINSNVSSHSGRFNKFYKYLIQGTKAMLSYGHTINSCFDATADRRFYDPMVDFFFIISIKINRFQLFSLCYMEIYWHCFVFTIFGSIYLFAIHYIENGLVQTLCIFVGQQKPKRWSTYTLNNPGLFEPKIG